MRFPLEDSGNAVVVAVPMHHAAGERVAVVSGVASGYRGQIVESEAQRLARERRRYQRAWRRFGWSEWVPKTMMAVFGLLALAIGLATGASRVLFLLGGVPGSTSLRLVGTLFAAWTASGPVALIATIAAVVWRNLVRCPRCEERFTMDFSVLDLYFVVGGDQCRHCGLPRGYLPTVEDLNDDEGGPG